MLTVTAHYFDSSGDAYDQCQYNENIKPGDLIVIPWEKIVGIAWTWPIAVTKEYGNLHQLVDYVSYSIFQQGRFEKHLSAAAHLATSLGYDL